jgi:glycosyltransferase involved in cell wall biosynthesis
MASDPLIIGYAGSLESFSPGKARTRNILRDLFWTYSVDNVDFGTRSGYYLFRALRHGLDKKYFNEADIRIRLWGMIAKENSQQVCEMKLEEMVHVDGYVSKEESRKRLEECDLLFLPLECGKNGSKPLFIPGKLYEYLKIGKPVFCLSTGGDAADILYKSGLGEIVSPYDEDAVAKRLAELVVRKKQGKLIFTANQVYINQFDFHLLTRKLAGVFDEVLEKGN